MAGKHFIALLLVPILGVLCTSYLSIKIGKRKLFITSLLYSLLC